MRIVYCINTLATFGGVETVTITKANSLAQYPGNKVWIITCSDNSLKTCIPLSDKVTVTGINGGLSWPFPFSVIQLPFQMLSLRGKLRKILKGIKPDIVVSTSGIDKWAVASIAGSWSTIREIHGVKDYRTRDTHNQRSNWISSLAEFIDYNIFIKRYDRIVVLTEEDQKMNWKHYSNVCVIPDPLRFSNDSLSTLDSKTVISVGRLVYQKNFSSLLRSFAIVVERFPDWNLDIYGDGEERNSLSGLISELSLEDNVFLHHPTAAIRDKLLQSSIFVLSSRFEGFAMVLIEAMNCGLPVVSYTCPCGPKDIITDGVDGFLVPEGDEQALADRICQLIGNEEDRKKMGNDAFISSKKFDINNITHQWMVLFGTLNDNQLHSSCL